MLAVGGLLASEREPYVRMAAALRRPRHLIMLGTPLENVEEEDHAAVNELRRALDAGELGALSARMRSAALSSMLTLNRAVG